MINDNIVEAIDLMIEMCSDENKAAGMQKLREFLCDYAEEDWQRFSPEEKREQITQHLLGSCSGGGHNY